MSVVLADDEVMLTVKPGQHGSTYGETGGRRGTNRKDGKAKVMARQSRRWLLIVGVVCWKASRRARTAEAEAAGSSLSHV